MMSGDWEQRDGRWWSRSMGNTNDTLKSVLTNRERVLVGVSRWPSGGEARIICLKCIAPEALTEIQAGRDKDSALLYVLVGDPYAVPLKCDDCGKRLKPKGIRLQYVAIATIAALASLLAWWW